MTVTPRPPCGTAPLDLRKHISGGEDSTRQFKADVNNAESLASEMAAFANSDGGTIFTGVDDQGTVTGLTPRDVSRVNQLISNAASHLVRSPLTVRGEKVALKNGRVVIVPTVEKTLAGISNIRNPNLFSYAATGLVP